jgi:hypothetical protein
MMEVGETCFEAPILSKRVNVVVDSDEPNRVIFARLAESEGPVSPADSGEILHDDKVELVRLDCCLSIAQRLAIKQLSARLTADIPPGDLAIVTVLDPLSGQCYLIFKASFVLVNRADPRDYQNHQSLAPARLQRGIQSNGHAHLRDGDAEAETIDTVCHSF